jgi:hypothetical protein
MHPLGQRSCLAADAQLDDRQGEGCGASVANGVHLQIAERVRAGCRTPKDRRSCALYLTEWQNNCW